MVAVGESCWFRLARTSVVAGKGDVTELPLLSSGWRIKYKVLVLSLPTSTVEDQTLVIAVELCRIEISRFLR